MITKYLYISLLLIGTSLLSVSAQEKNNSASEAASFLKITPDARSGGMGNVGVALPGNASSFYHNAAASLFSEQKAEIAYSYTPWMRELTSGRSLNSFSGFYKLGNKQSIVVGFRHFSHPENDITDNEGNITNTFKPKEWSLDLGYSRLLTKNLGVALTLHYINSDMGSYQEASSGSAVAFDLGVYYRHKAALLDNASSWSVGLQVANIGSKIKYLENKYDLPGMIKLGGGLNLPFSEKHQLQCALDLGYQIIPSGSSSFNVGIGAEYTFLKYGILRGGYHFGDKDKGDDNYATVGAGFNVYHLHGDFSYLLANSDSALKNTFRFTVGIDFGLFKSKKNN